MRDILIAEDNELLCKGIAAALRSERYSVRTVGDGEAVLAALAEKKPDVLILDIAMPKRDGLSVCRIIRKQDPRLPILMLTAKAEEADKIEGLSIGADDYLTKPFSIGELLARIAALLRRALLSARPKAEETGRFRFGGCTVDPQTLTVTRPDGTTASLLARELGFLELFASNPNRVFERNDLLDRFWGVSYYGSTRTLDTRLAALRQKLGPDGARIESVHGVGYRYVPT